MVDTRTSNTSDHGMPSPDSCLIRSKTVCQRSRIKSNKTNLRVSDDHRLSISRTLFNISRKRVENLKRSTSLKRNLDFPQLMDNEWITSGQFGSRDAVLVFRTNILNPKIRKNLSAKTSSTFLEESNSNLPTTNTILDIKANSSSSNSSILNLNDAYSSPMPSTSWNDLRDTSKINGKQTLKNSIKHLNDSVKHFRDSLSSSDNSISSEGETVHTIHKSKRFNRNANSVDNVGVANADALYDSLQPEDMVGEMADTGEEDEKDAYDESEYGANMPAYHLKITYKFMQTETKLLRKIFNIHGLSEVESEENFSILWTGVHMKLDILRHLAPYQRVNHFPRSYELTRKDRLYKNIERMQHLRGMRHFDIVPQSFILPLEYKDLVSAHNKHRGPWIVKPAASSRGRGIFIVNTPDQIPSDEQVLVSKYVADPLCIDGHKCDLRVYVLVTSFDPLIIYLYEEGLVRLATVKYDRNADNLWNPCMHLCNYSINKYHSDYIRSSDAHDEDVGHKWTLSALLRHLKSQKCDTRQLMLNIEDLIIKSILACAQTIISACRMFVPSGNNCFELYGFDILIDDTLKPWLLEVNLSPSMGVDSPLDTKVKACLITDLLTCVGIPAFSPEMRGHYDSKWTRFRNLSCTRRTSSADSMPTQNSRRTGGKCTNAHGTHQLTLDEQRVIRNARLQNARRGGFVRIFPTADTMQRYGSYLDPANGIPVSTPVMQGQTTFHTMIMQHNYNQMLFKSLYGKDTRTTKENNSQIDRMNQYERALETESEIPFVKKQIVEKCEEEGKRLRKQVLKSIGNGSELTQFQARQTFSLYLESILRRLTVDPKDHHEKIILKFLTRYGGGVKPPVLFRNSQNMRVISKARSAMVAKLLGDFLELYNRDTESYVDSFDHFGMIPSTLYSEFLSQAQEADLEAVLTLHTSLTGIMPYLYNRCGLSVPPTPPIPSGVHGFLRALPAMVISGGTAAREFSKYDGYIKCSERECDNLPDVATKGKFTKKC